MNCTMALSADIVNREACPACHIPASGMRLIQAWKALSITSTLRKGTLRRAGPHAMASTSKDAPEVVPHVREVQILLSDREVGLKGSDLLAQDEQLLNEEQLPIHG